MNGQTCQRKGKVTASPRAKAKVKGKGKRKHSGKGNHNQDQAGSPNEDEQVYNVIELNLSVMSMRMMILKVTVWIEQLLCFAFRSAIVFSMDPTELPSSSKRVSDGNEEPAGTHENSISQRERYFTPLDVEMIDQLLTLEVLCPRVQWIMRRRFRQRMYKTV